MQLKPNVCNYRALIFFSTIIIVSIHVNLIQYTIDYNGMDYLNIEFVPYEV